MPKVSIILPTYNRADTIIRAIKSVQAQTFQDWELIVVDDGSSDETASLLVGIEPRMTVIRQANRGFTEARNTGIRAARGSYIAFLDSDDEFLPHHLELGVAFLDSYTTESFLSTELLEDFGHGRRINHYRIETSDWYPRKAASIGSHRLDLPPGETDDYMRVYESREAIGDWGRAIVEAHDTERRARLYRGMIFDTLRYDFLITITATVMRANVFEKLGLPDPRWGMGSDFHFMASLCRAFPTNYISLPTFIKHEFAASGELPAHGHVVTGKSTLTFIRDWQAAWDDLFWNNREPDPEVLGLRCLRHFWMAQQAARAGDRRLALEYLSEVRQGLPRFVPAIALDRLLRWVPSLRWAQKLYRVAFSAD
jgi:glycosyltransferase involved in cell wall biosynthesis